MRTTKKHDPEEFRSEWKKACENGTIGAVLDEFGKRYEARKKELANKR